MVYIDTSPRECGDAIDGGYYFGSSMSGFGTIKPIHWVLGDFCDDIIDASLIPGPGQYKTHIPLSAVTGGMRQWESARVMREMYKPEVFQRPLYEALRSNFGTFGLFDHIGASHYTPYSFAKELNERGPNRRTSPAFAREVAELTGGRPFPIWFTAKLPAFHDTEQRDIVEELLKDWLTEPTDGYSWEPTWKRENFGPRVRHNNGSDHYGRHLIAALHAAERGNSAARSDTLLVQLRRICDKMQWVEQAFCGSVITMTHKYHGSDNTYLSSDDRRSGIVSSYGKK